MARASRSEWKARVEQWNASGLTGLEFAARLGVNEGTLRHWKWLLGHERRTRRGRPKFVEIAPATLEAVAEGSRFELVLRDERRLYVPPSFDETALRRLLAVLEGR